MMYIKTKVLPSKIEGLGIFADEFVPKGTILWKFTSGFDRKFTEEELPKLPKQVQEYLEIYSYLSKKSHTYIFPVDNAKYFNHSKDPNSKSEYIDDEEEVVTTAIKDIALGEEITDDYTLFDDQDGPYSH